MAYSNRGALFHRGEELCTGHYSSSGQSGRPKPMWAEAADTVSCPVEGLGHMPVGLVLEMWGKDDRLWTSHAGVNLEKPGLRNQVSTSLRNWCEGWQCPQFCLGGGGRGRGLCLFRWSRSVLLYNVHRNC